MPGDDASGPVSSSVRTRNDGIFLREPLERTAELLLIGLGLRLDRDRDHRLGELHRSSSDRLCSRRRACRRW